ncbi:unnamed protein product [Oppiella nova]|uniref:DUF4781 domain-containing protein n=1 Tax=Oppiella nova TaxID=334625 RepID=A0A7R9M1C5_9ACAR|nr:unnamed protein product [Oppiella nova]CAG2168957.1 unnamed protein product [Oppiella nova]
MSDKISQGDLLAAQTIIEHYLDRPDPDGYQELYGDRLRNTIGFAMGLPVTLPQSKMEIERARQDQFCYFRGTSLQAIEVIKNMIDETCPRTVRVCVLPTVLAYQSKLYELPVFRVLDKRDVRRFVDNCGRYYKDWDDWMTNNKLPAGFVVYPNCGKLQSSPTHPGWPDCSIVATPSNTMWATIVKDVDFAAAVGGAALGVAGLFTGGLAIPVALEVLTAYGLFRSAEEITDRVRHGESMNPITDSRARQIWLGVAADILGIGAMGASMRLASLAAKGENITIALRSVVNTLNAVSFSSHSACVVTGWLELLDHIDQATPVEIVLQFLQTAFFVKGMYSYRTAGQIITEARQGFFASVTRDLNENDQQHFQNARRAHNNDAEFIRFMRAGGGTSSPVLGAQILAELQSSGANYYIDDQGKVYLIADEGISTTVRQYDKSLLERYPAPTRAVMFRVLGGHWDAIDGDSFDAMRRHIGYERLFNLIGQIADHYQISPNDAARGLTYMYQRAGSGAAGLNPRFESNSIVIASGHSFTLAQLESFQPIQYRAITEYLLPLNPSESSIFNKIRTIYNNDNELLSWLGRLPYQHGYQAGRLLCQMYSEGLMKLDVYVEGNGQLMLRRQLRLSQQRLSEIEPLLRLSLQRLSEIEPPLRCTIFKALEEWDGHLDTLRRQIPKSLRFKFEQERRDAVHWYNAVRTRNRLSGRPHDSYPPHEMDRLIAMRDCLATRGLSWKMAMFPEMVSTWALQEATSVSEFASNVEYALTRIDDDVALILSTSRGDKDTIRKTVVNKLLGDQDARTRLTSEFNAEIEFVTNHQMIGVSQVPENLPDTELIAQIRTQTVRFGSARSAAYHLAKHPTDPKSDYIRLAQQTIRHLDSLTEVTWSQDGTARTIKFTWNFEGRKAYVVVVLEDNGRVLLCSHMRSTLPARRARG